MISLYPYQATDTKTLVEFFHNGGTTAAIIYATGSGKSLLIRTVASFLNRPFVIAVPSNNIKNSFVAESETVLVDNQEVTLSEIREFEDRQTKNLRDYLSQDLVEHGVVVSHQLLSSISLENISCKNKLLFIDEGHHVSESVTDTKITKFVNEWIAEGGVVCAATATPVRTNNVESLASKAPKEGTVIRNLYQQMRDGFAPENIKFDLIRVESASIHDNDVIGVPIDSNKLIEEIYHQLEIDGFPKTIIRCKNLGDENKNHSLITDITKYLTDNGLRVIPATSKTSLDQLNDILLKERKISSLKESQYDVIVGMNAVFEGIDWPIASHFYFVGIPISVLLATQGLGRTMRPKQKWGDYHPSVWANTSKVTMFTGSVVDICNKHAGEVLKIVSYIGSLKPLNIFDAIKHKFNDSINIDGGESIKKEIDARINEEALPKAREYIIRIQMEFYKAIHAIKRLSSRDIVNLFSYYEKQETPGCKKEDIQMALAHDKPKEFLEKTVEVIDKEPKPFVGDIGKYIDEALNMFIDDTEIPCDESDFGKIQSLHVTDKIIEAVTERLENQKTSIAEALK